MVDGNRLRGMSICRECMEDKIRYEGSTLPCLQFKALQVSGSLKTPREILCGAGSYHWCPRFCNAPNRVFDIKTQSELPSIIGEIKDMWTLKKLCHVIQK